MAGLMNKIRTLVGVEEEEYEYEEYEEINYDQRRQYEGNREYGLGEEVKQSNRSQMWEQREREREQVREREQPREREQRYQANEPSRYYQRENVINMPGNDRLQELTARFNIVVIEPKSFEECPKLVDSLKAHKPVIVNLEKIETETARKIFDFLSGATYAVNGDLQKIANNIFVFLPANVEVSTTIDNHQDSNNWKL